VTAHWESATLSHVAVPPAVLAGEVAPDLCEPSRIVTEVIEECLETLDAVLELEASELLADHLRWQAGRLAVVAPQVTDDEVVAAIVSAVGRYAGPEVVEEVQRQLRRARRTRRFLHGPRAISTTCFVASATRPSTSSSTRSPVGPTHRTSC